MGEARDTRCESAEHYLALRRPPHREGACAIDDPGGLYCGHSNAGQLGGAPVWRGVFRHVSAVTGPAASVHDAVTGVCMVSAADGRVRCGGPNYWGHTVIGTRGWQVSTLPPNPQALEIEINAGCALYDEWVCWAQSDQRAGNRRGGDVMGLGGIAAIPMWD